MKLPLFFHHQLLVPILLILSSLLVYLQTFSGTWTMDDYSVIVNNPDIRSVGNFVTNSFPGRPLREITYLLDYALFGLDPWGYHFQNIFWHALNSWLVYLAAIRLNLSRSVALISSLLFLFHPVNVEVVANSSHRKDSLALAFILMAFLCWIRIYEQTAVSRKIICFIASIALWVTAYYAKGNSIVFPAIVLMYEYAIVAEEKRMLVRWKWLLPAIGISSIVGLIVWYLHIYDLPSFRLAVIGAFVKNESLASFSLTAYILMVLKSFVLMASKVVFPFDLSMEYVYAVPKSLFDPWVIASLLLIVAVAAFVFYLRKSSHTAFFLLLFAGILWLPTSNIFWHFSYFAADRYMYAPSAALCILVVMLSERILSGTGKYFAICWVCILGIFVILTWRQSSVWKDEMSLYKQMLKVSPRSLEAMIGLSSAHYSAKNYDISIRYAKMAIERDFTDFRPYMTIGNIHFLHGRLNEALELLLEAERKKPDSPEVHNALGSLYDDLGNSDKAIEQFKSALKLRPDYFEANGNLGVAFERRKNYIEAESALKRALAANVNYVPAWFNLGVVRYRTDDKLGARSAFAEAVKREPSHIDALTNLSVVCRELGDNVCYSDAVNRIRIISPAAAEKLLKAE